MDKAERDETEEKNVMDEYANMSEEEIDKLLKEQAQMIELLENLDQNSDFALKIFEDLKRLPEEIDVKYEEKTETITQALSELNQKLKPLKEKIQE